MADDADAGGCSPRTLAPGVVLDTNAVLDWLVFRDPGMQAWARWIETGSVRWLACPPMRDELEHMLRSTRLARWAPDIPGVLGVFDRWAQISDLPALPLVRWRCSDPDDQVFLDFALCQGARWLVSHDRALRSLATKARRVGLCIGPPRSTTTLAGPASAGPVAPPTIGDTPAPAPAVAGALGQASPPSATSAAATGGTRP